MQSLLAVIIQKLHPISRFIEHPYFVSDLSVESPLRVQGNLTGTPRRLKDLTADWYNGKLKWKRNCQKGFVVCNKIGDIKMDWYVGLREAQVPL